MDVNVNSKGNVNENVNTNGNVKWECGSLGIGVWE